MDASILILTLCFFVIALVYASVGFGGGSSYLAVLALPVLAVDYQLIRPTALLCNIVVVTGGTYIFYKEGKFEIKKVWPFIAASIPMAYLGGYYPIKEHTFFIILGVTLICASFLLWFQKNIQEMKKENYQRSGNLALNLGIGSSVGFLSGLVSIGGGIFLSPILHLLNWDDAKKISALASLFILVNSISGLAGQIQKGVTIDWIFILPLLVAVLAGGQIGSRLGARTFNPVYIKRITAALILVAGINILINHL